jgi:hypothetical protein
MKAIRNLLYENGQLILLTFEVFWIVVFLIDRISSGGGSGIPQFVYVNF